MKKSIVTAIVGAVFLAAEISAPRIGIVLDGRGALRPVTGIAGNLISGEPLASGVLSAAASDSNVVLKTAEDIRILDVAGEETARTPMPGGAALFAFSPTGWPEYVWLVDQHALLHWCGMRFCAARLPVTAISGDVVAIGTADFGYINLAVARNGAIEVLNVHIRDGAIAGTTPLPNATGAPLLLADGPILYAVPGALVFRDAGGHERRTPFSHAVSGIVPISSTWALATATDGNRRFAVRLVDGAVFQIPEVR